jgi:HSP20 family molecular chaperone IbpA
MATERTQVKASESQTNAVQQSERTRAEAAIAPVVDIFEDAEGITLQADMPGVSKDRLNVRVEGDSLLLEGDIQFELPAQAEALYADVRASSYRRSFALSRELESDKIQASLKDGALTVRIPKRAELRPRRIEVQAA